MTGEAELADLITRVEQAVAQLTDQNVAGRGSAQQLMDIADQLGTQTLFGTVLAAGQLSNGSSYVSVLDSHSNSYYSSVWPRWAFEVAREALLGDKKVAVVSNGPPFGSNLLIILLFAQ